MRDPQIIAQEITRLVAELAEVAGAATPVKAEPATLISTKKPAKAGPMAGIRVLLDEGNFDSPMDRENVAKVLREHGWVYSRDVVGVALMRLVRERTLTRLRDSSENWMYARRK